MKLRGKCLKSNKFWIAEIPALDLATQGRTKKEALFMIQDAIRELIFVEGTRFQLFIEKDGDFSIQCNKPKLLIALMLKRLRKSQNLTIKEVINRLGLSSKNSYAQYEQAKSEPTTSKLSEFIQAINPSLNVPIYL